MRFDVETAGRTRTIEITDARGRRQVSVDGRAREVDAARAGEQWSLLVGVRSYEVALVQRAGGEYAVHVNGRPFVVRVTPQASGTAARRGVPGAVRGGPDAGTHRGPHPVVAPMPGRVVKVLVKPGDAVTARQGLVVVEAMKMENELRSPRAGVVSEVPVAQGALVDAGTVLVVIA